MKGKLMGVLTACLAASVGMCAMSACKPEEPEIQEGAVYVTEAKSFWAGVGSGYLSFEVKEEPQEPVEGEVYGNVFYVMVDSGSGYSPYLSGNWELEGEEGNFGTLTLTATWDTSSETPTMLDGAESGVPKTYEPEDGKYSIGVSIPSAGVLTFTLDPVANKVGEGETPVPDEPDTPDDPDAPCTEHVDEDGDGKCDVCGETMPDEPDVPDEKQVQIALWAEASAEGFGMTINADAKLEVYTDSTWTMFIKTDVPDPNADYTEAASGTWEVDMTTYATTLTVTSEAMEGSLSETITIACDVSGYPDLKYTADVAYTSTGMTFDFAFTTEEPAEEPEQPVEEAEHFVVSFDFGNGTVVDVLTSTFTASDGTTKEYITSTSAPATYQGDAPYILGKRFAGWDTLKDPVLENGVSPTRFLLDTNSNSWYDVGAIEKDVMEVTEDMTVYARWVEPQWIETEEDLRNMKNDLAGWYILKNDITLTEEWMPVGTYYASYEYLSPSWWTYAFTGQLDGNGYSIKGLEITTLMPYGDTVHPTEGSGNGTTALFGCVCNADISDLVIEKPVINVSDYRDAKHAYVSVIAAFAQQSPTFTNIRIVDAEINVTTNNINYIAVAGVVAGHWGGTVKHCSVTGTINVIVNYSEDYTIGGNNLYVGGVAGEGYGWVENTSAELDIGVKLNDARPAASTETDPTTGQPVTSVNNVYMGGIGGSTAYTQNVRSGGSLALDFSGVENAGMSVYMGGLGGIQRYGYLDYSETDTAISVTTNGKENTLLVGSFLGGYDAITSIINLQGFNDLKVRQSTDAGVTYTLDGEAQDVEFIGYAPTTAAEMAVAEIVAGAMGVDLTPYKNADGTYNIYGTDRCVKLGE